MNDDAAGCVLFLAGILVGAIGGVLIAHDYHHDRWCIERLAHAATPADTVKIYQDDHHCLKANKP